MTTVTITHIANETFFTGSEPGGSLRVRFTLSESIIVGDREVTGGEVHAYRALGEGFPSLTTIGYASWKGYELTQKGTRDKRRGFGSISVLVSDEATAEVLVAVQAAYEEAMGR